jgi:hypothetical protein
VRPLTWPNPPGRCQLVAKYMKTAFTELFHLNYSVVHLISKNFYYLVPSMDSQGTQSGANMLSCTMRAGLQRFWLSALAGFVTGDENASSKTPHGAYSFPLCRMQEERECLIHPR